MVRKMQMFADGRSRKVVFLAHCLLNQNAISDGTAVYPAAFRELVQFFLEHQVGIVLQQSTCILCSAVWGSSTSVRP